LLDRIFYEYRLHWKSLLLTPLVISVLTMLYTGVQLLLHASPARTFLMDIEACLPLAASIIISSLIAREPVLELHMTLPAAYRNTGLLRLGLLLLTFGLCACLSLGVVRMLDFWFLPRFILSWSPAAQWGINQLIWLAPLLWFSAAGLCLTMITKNSAVSSGILAGIWLSELVLWGPFLNTPWLRALYPFPTTMWIYQGPGISLPEWFFDPVWLYSRLEMLALASGLFFMGWLLLHHLEGLLKGTTAA